MNTLPISSKKWARLWQTAISLSADCESRCRHVSFLLDKNKVVSYGVNELKTDTFAYKLYKYPYRHSELSAIKNCHHDIDISKLTLINLRISRKDNSLINSRPCSSCIKLIDLYGIRDVFYTTDNGALVPL